MEPAENNKETAVKKPKRAIWKIALLIIAVLAVVLIMGVIFAVPAYVSSESCRQMILAKANAGGAGRVDFADLSMSWSSGINVSGISYKDKSDGLSVAVKEFSTKPQYMALLTGNLSFGATVIDEPKVEINVEKLKTEGGGQKTKGGGQKTETKTGLPIGQIDLVVKNGDVKVTGGNGTIDISQINSTVNLRPEGEQTSFDVGAKIAGVGEESTIKAEGDITPGKSWDLKKTSGNVTVEVNTLDLASLESLLAITGVDVEAKGVITTNIKASIKQGMLETITGEVKGKNLDITAPQLKGDRIKTSILDAEVSAAKAGDLMNVGKLSLATDWLKAEANGSAPMSMATLEDFLKPGSKYELKANMECDIPAVTSQLPNTLGLKEGMKITGGKMTGEVETLTEGGVKKLSGEVSIEGLAGMVDGKAVSIPEPIRAEAIITADGKQIKFEKAGVTSSFANISCTGTLEAFNYQASTDLDKLTRELGQFVDIAKYKLAGQVTSEGQISNNENTAMIISQSRIDGLRANPTTDITISEPSATIDVTAAIEKKTDLLLVKQFNAETSLGRFSVKDGRIPMGKESKGPMELTATAKGVDLARVQPYLVMAKAISKDVQLGGIAESDVTLIHKGDNYNLKTTNTKITNLMVKAPEKTPFVQEAVSLVMDADVNPTTKTWEADIELTGTNINIKGNFNQKSEEGTSNLQGNAQLDYDWKTLMGMLSAFMPAGLVVEGKRKDTISFSSRYPAADTNAMLANLNAQAKVGFDKADYMGLHMGATNVNIKADKGLLTIEPFTTVVNNGQFNFGGSADFKQKPAFFRTPGPMQIVKDVQINDEIANRFLNKINPIFANSSRVSGLANLDCNQMVIPVSGGTNEQINIAGTISLTQVRMQSGVLSMLASAAGGSPDNILMIHPTLFAISQGFVRYQNMQMDLGTLPFFFGGTVPLDPNRKIENFSVELPVTGLGKVIRTDEAQPGRGSAAYFKGTPKKPELDLGKTLLEQAGRTGLELLLEQAGKRK